MNYTFLQGRPVTDPEAKNSKRTGKVFCTYRMACKGPYRGPDTPREVLFITVVAFGPQARGILNSLSKGAFHTIRGQLANREWFDAIGNKRQEIVVIVKDYEIHQYLQQSTKFVNLEDAEGNPLIPKEITDSLAKQIDAEDEDIPDYNGKDIDDLFKI